MSLLHKFSPTLSFYSSPLCFIPSPLLLFRHFCVRFHPPCPIFRPLSSLFRPLALSFIPLAPFSFPLSSFIPLAPLSFPSLLFHPSLLLFHPFSRLFPPVFHYHSPSQLSRSNFPTQTKLDNESPLKMIHDFIRKQTAKCTFLIVDLTELTAAHKSCWRMKENFIPDPFSKFACEKKRKKTQRGEKSSLFSSRNVLYFFSGVKKQCYGTG